MVISNKLRGFSNYLLTECGAVIRVSCYTKHHHYREPRFISPNSRGQYVLISDKCKKESWTIKQIENIKIPYNLDFKTSSKLKISTPF